MKLCGAALLLVLLSSVPIRADEDPVIDGQPLSEWLKLIKGGIGGAGNINDYVEALSIVRSLGPRDAAAVPQLVKALGDNNRTVNTAVTTALRNIGAAALPALQPLLQDRDKTTRQTALTVVGGIGKEADKLLPAVRAALKDPEVAVRVSAALALHQIDDKADGLPILSEALAKEQPLAVRVEAIKALGTMGATAKPAAPQLVKLLAETESTAPLQAALALSLIDPQVKEALPVLMAALKKSDRGLRGGFPANREEVPSSLTVPMAIARYGVAAVPGLIALLKDEKAGDAGDDPRVGGPPGARSSFLSSPRSQAATILGTIGPAAKDAVPALVAVLKERDTALTRAAQTALGRIGPVAIPNIVRTLTDPALHATATTLLAQYGRKITPDLLQAANDKDAILRAGVMQVLGDRRYWSDDVKQAVRKGLDDPNGLVQVNAAETLWRLDRRETATVAALLLKLTKHEDALVRARAAEALGRLAPSLKDIAESMGKALEDRDAGVRLAAARTLRRLGTEAKPAAAALRTALKDQNAEVRLNVALTLSYVDPEAAPAVAILVEQLKPGNDRRTRLERAEPNKTEIYSALRRFGKTAVPALASLATDPAFDGNRGLGLRSTLREQFVQLLGEVGKGSQEALSTLNALLRDQNEEVKVVAAAALVRLDPRAEQGVSVLIEMLANPNHAATAADALAEQGTPAVPALLAVLQNTEPAEPDDLSGAETGLSPVQRQFGPRGQAAQILGRIGPRTKTVLPALLAALADESLQPAAVSALHLMGEQLPILAMRKALESPQLGTRAGAAMVLIAHKDERERATTVLHETLEKGSLHLRIRAARFLVSERVASTPLLDALRRGLAQDGEKHVEKYAQLLGLLGAAARPAVKELTTALKSSNRTLQREAAIALSRIDRQAVAALPVLLEAVKEQGVGLTTSTSSSPRSSVRFRSGRHLPHAEALLRFGESAAPGLAALFADKNLKAPTPARRPRGPGGGGFPAARGTGDSPRVAIAQLLGEFGEEARAAVPALKEGLKDTDVTIRRAAAEALAYIDPSAVEAIAALVSRSRTSRSSRSERPTWSETFTRTTSAESEARLLARFGKAAVPELIRLLKVTTTESSAAAAAALRSLSRDPRVAAAQVLGELGAEAREAVPELRKLLEEKDEVLRSSAAVALWRIEKKADGLVPALLEALAEASDDVSELGFTRRVTHNTADVLSVLVEMGPAGREAVPLLIDLLDEALSPEARSQFANRSRYDEVSAYLDALGRFGAAAKSAVPLLKRALHTPTTEADYRQPLGALALALWRIEGKTDEVLPLVRRSLETPLTAELGVVNAMGPAARELAPLLKKRLDTPGVGLQVAEALLQVEPDSKEAVGALKKGLTDANPQTRLLAVQTVGRLKEKASALQTELEAARNDAERNVRAAVRAALKRG